VSQQQLNAIKKDLQSIINELEDIAKGIKKDFEGIGNELCASAISAEVERYREAKQKLDKIDIEKIKEEHAQKNASAASVPSS